ncbi:MAG: biotin/lipoyl-binding protein [Candidatus Cloacimonetes bacterium]|nr:biotin/lipoyl-binding protein [Candidatus Cloacimonadota bacterium]
MKTYKMKIDGQSYEARVRKYDGSTATVNVNGVDYHVELDNQAPQGAPRLVRAEKSAPSVSLRSDSKPAIAGGQITAPIPGVIIDVKVKPGDVVSAGDVLCILEAMKMESEITAPFEGTVKEIRCTKGGNVNEGDVLVVLEAVGGAAEPAPQQPTVQKPVQPQAAPAAAPTPPPPPAAAACDVCAPIPGTVLDIKVKVGDMVQAEQTVVILEAMKMESEIAATTTGRVKSIPVSKGENVQENQLLVEMEG